MTLHGRLDRPSLPHAVTVGDWLNRIHTAAQADQDAGHLPPLYGLDLQVLGRSEIHLPARTMSSG